MRAYFHCAPVKRRNWAEILLISVLVNQLSIVRCKMKLFHVNDAHGYVKDVIFTLLDECGL